MATEIDLRYPDSDETKLRFDDDYYIHIKDGKINICCDYEPVMFTLNKRSIEILEGALKTAKESLDGTSKDG